MQQGLKLQIPEPCHENWSSMTNAEQGRFCSSCSKIVVDFSLMTDRQVLEYFSGYTGNTCGRFQSDQLNRIIASDVRKQRSWMKYMLSILVPAFLITNRSMAQGSVKKDTIVCSPQDKLQTPVTIRLGRVKLDKAGTEESVIQGIVKDEAGMPVQGAVIVIKGTSKGVVTDSAGAFSLTQDISQSVTLAIIHAGYIVKEIEVKAGYKPGSPIILQMEPAWMGDVIVTRILPAKKTVFHQFRQLVADSIRKQHFTVYPNPATKGSLVQTTVKLNKGNYFFRILDVNGRVLQEERVTITNNRANISFNLYRNILPGHYTLLLVDSKSRQLGTQQLIVN